MQSGKWHTSWNARFAKMYQHHQLSCYSAAAKLLGVGYASRAAWKQVIRAHCVVQLILALCNCLARMASTVS